MPSRSLFCCTLVLSGALLGASGALAQAPQPLQQFGTFPAPPASPEVTIVESATSILNEVMAIPASAIPRSMLSDAEGIAIVPGLIKGGFVVGARHGRGVVVTRANGGWTAPMFITVTGGSVGWQAGLQSIDLVLVFKTKKSVQSLMSGKFTIGADASAAAGPVGRETSVATDARLKSEIYSYSRSRGLFAGVAIDGSVISIDGAADNRYYYNGVPPVNPTQAKPLPPSAIQLLETVAKYTTPVQPTTTAGTPQPPTADVSAAANQTAAQMTSVDLPLASQSLNRILDANWQNYLALPADLNADSATWANVVKRFDRVATDPQYSTLSARPEFQQLYGLVKSYSNLRSAAAPIALPAPPQ